MSRQMLLAIADKALLNNPYTRLTAKSSSRCSTGDDNTPIVFRIGFDGLLWRGRGETMRRTRSRSPLLTVRTRNGFCSAPIERHATAARLSGVEDSWK